MTMEIIGTTRYDNPIFQKHLDATNNIIQDLKTGINSKRLITLPSGMRVFEQIQPNKDEIGTYARYHYVHGNKKNAILQNGYLEEKDVERHLLHSLADETARKEK